jgi:hypothetical protein
LIDCESDGSSELFYSGLVLYKDLVDGLKEECIEGIQRILVHMVDYTETDYQEIEHSSFCGNQTINFSRGVDLYFGLLGLDTLFFDISGGLLGEVELVDKFCVF